MKLITKHEKKSRHDTTKLFLVNSNKHWIYITYINVGSPEDHIRNLEILIYLFYTCLHLPTSKKTTLFREGVSTKERALTRYQKHTFVSLLFWNHTNASNHKPSEGTLLRLYTRGRYQTDISLCFYLTKSLSPAILNAASYPASQLSIHLAAGVDNPVLSCTL